MFGTAQQTAGEARAAFAALDRLGQRLDQLVQSSDDQVRAVAFAREIRQQPSRLLFSRPPPDRELP